MREDDWLDRPGTSEATRGIWGTVLASMYQQAEQWALTRLSEDVAQPLFQNGNRYLARGAAVPMGLLLAGEHQMADRIYSKLIEQVDAYGKSRGKAFYRGPLLNAQAVCRLSLGQIDLGIGELLFAAETEASEHLGLRPQDTTAIDLVASYFIDPTMRLIEDWCALPALQLNLEVPKSGEIRDIVELLSGAWTLLAAMRQAQVIWEAHLKYPSSYSAPRLLDSLRGICASLEDLACAIGATSSHQHMSKQFKSVKTLTLGRALKALFADPAQRPDWWDEFSERQGLTTFRADGATEDFQEKLEKIRMSDVRPATRCFLGAVLTRNYCSHQLRPDPTFIQVQDGTSPFLYSMQVTLLSLILLLRESRTAGHIS